MQKKKSPCHLPYAVLSLVTKHEKLDLRKGKIMIRDKIVNDEDLHQVIWVGRLATFFPVFQCTKSMYEWNMICISENHC